MSTSALKATFQFQNFDTRAVTFSPYDPTSTAVTGFKNRVIAFNTAGGENNFESISDTFVSDVDGVLAPCTGIRSAEIITTDQTLIYSKSAYLGERALNSETVGE